MGTGDLDDLPVRSKQQHIERISRNEQKGAHFDSG
jgi:hypothetical protein